MPLTPEQLRAAHLLGAGHLRNEVAAEVGVNPATLSRWGKLADFKQVVEHARLQAVANDPEPRSILTAALSAVDRDGRPDHRIRVTAALKLIDIGPAPDAPARANRGETYDDDGNPVSWNG